MVAAGSLSPGAGAAVAVYVYVIVAVAMAADKMIQLRILCKTSDVAVSSDASTILVLAFWECLVRIEAASRIYLRNSVLCHDVSVSQLLEKETIEEIKRVDAVPS